MDAILCNTERNDTISSKGNYMYKINLTIHANLIALAFRVFLFFLVEDPHSCSPIRRISRLTLMLVWKGLRVEIC